MTMDPEDRKSVIDGLRSEITKTELGRLYTNCQTGIFHLRLAIDAFDSLSHGTDTDDLVDFLAEAVEMEDMLDEALK